MVEKELICAERHLGLGLLFRHFRGRIAITWLFVLVENTLLALLPLFLGRAIDALLEAQTGALWEISIVMGALLVVSLVRRIYDTRVYGTMRVWFGSELVKRSSERSVSKMNARLDMGREMVDFLELHLPELVTASVQMVVSIAILWHFHVNLGVSAFAAIIVLVVIYGLMHRRFYRLNSHLNAQKERQVTALESHRPTSLAGHLKRLRKSEVHLSDADAVLYGSIFAAMFAFVLTNLWFASMIPSVTAGAIFAILSYSWELVESGTTLPAVLQQWTRLSEIRNRINEIHGTA
ncbi:MAG: ABC-type bacteriocin/lantibiotic exporter with double-glycine peptidase domain [Arenicella sp.]|jgi:ABC-type bacteriocin/lantibiotic exporter with double-glycine peptidase domain